MLLIQFDRKKKLNYKETQNTDILSIKGATTDYNLEFTANKVSVRLLKYNKGLNPYKYYTIIIVILIINTIIFYFIHHPDLEQFYSVIVIVLGSTILFIIVLGLALLKRYKSTKKYSAEEMENLKHTIESYEEKILISALIKVPYIKEDKLMHLIIDRKTLSDAIIMDIQELNNSVGNLYDNKIQKIFIRFVIHANNLIKGKWYFYTIAPNHGFFEIINEENFPLDFNKQEYLPLFGSRDIGELSKLKIRLNTWIDNLQ